MEGLEKLIRQWKAYYPEFEYYFLLTKKVREHVNSQPDHAIESCKSLYEGICKTILDRLDPTFNESKKSRNGLHWGPERLLKEVNKILGEKEETYEADFLGKFPTIVQALNKIRGDRGDVSHGRVAPKALESQPDLANLVANISDHILCYILSHFFHIHGSEVVPMDHASKDLEAYNDWLNDLNPVSIGKKTFSELLFENDYDDYQSRYDDIYLPEIKERDSLNNDQEDEEEKEILNPVLESPFQKEVPLISTYDETTFWTDSRSASLASFAQDNHLEVEPLKATIGDYLATQMRPLPDSVEKAMPDKTSLLQRKEVLPPLTDLITAFADQLQENPPA